MSEENKSGTTVLKKNSFWTYVIIILAAALIIGAFVFFEKGNGNGGNTGERVNIAIGSAPVLGDANAPVTIVIFSDFSCPFCAAASGANPELENVMKSRTAGWEPAVSNVIKDYVDSGKVKLAFKYYPGHGAGEQAMLVAWCLNDQGLFWKFHDKAFANYESTNDLAKMKELAKEVGADTTALDSCLNTKKYDSKLASDAEEGKKIGLQGTPSFYVDGIPVEGAVPYSDIKKVIDSELNK
jgi:protein-disulfide isomerase